MQGSAGKQRAHLLKQPDFGSQFLHAAGFLLPLRFVPPGQLLSRRSGRKSFSDQTLSCSCQHACARSCHMSRARSGPGAAETPGNQSKHV